MAGSAAMVGGRRCGNDGAVKERTRALVDDDWEQRLRVDKPVLRGGGVHAVAADLGDNDAMSFLLDQTCIIVVPEEASDAARALVDGLKPEEAFTAEVLRRLVGFAAQVDGPSWHSYVDGDSFHGTADPAVRAVAIDDESLRAFLESVDLADWAESGFPMHPRDADPLTTHFWTLPNGEEVLAAGNMTEWRGLPADVGVLTRPSQRGRGLAGRVVATMVAAALPAVEVVRYRALASNVASLAVARQLGFELYGQNLRARRLRG